VMMGGLEVWGVLALLPIMLYNGKKGRGNAGFKWFGYAFYPAHRLIFRLIMTYA